MKRLLAAIIPTLLIVGCAPAAPISPYMREPLVEDQRCTPITPTLVVCENLPAPERTERVMTRESLIDGRFRVCGCDSFGIRFCRVVAPKVAEVMLASSDLELACARDMNL
ncbi:hypothetical protein NJBCHELONAE_01750 [Mycobacteroides chelonae]|uniref:hypothetical protein n=1 Tax=Mycobacteroides chelonae TaxID=1774 RepID=UPI0021DCD421|nr:hypothetical protein [Mycobacteroides chelonae]GLE54864.1 hypothetical protein NJBCHELONAE_01750 [Mycobacteroides chelonae]